ncbi:MAG: Kelch repeat-containing protein [Planctomycetota bacterium]
MQGRYAHCSVTLPDKSILSSGGYYTITDYTAELYYPPTSGDGSQGNASFTGSDMACGRDRHTMTLLTKGPGQGIVVVVGGERDDFLFNQIPIDTAEVYDHSLTTVNPAWNGNVGIWTPVGMAMSEKRNDHTATLLYNGQILIAGGFNAVGAAPSRTAEIFDPFGLGNTQNAPWAGIDLTGKFDWTRDPQGNQTVLSNLMTGVGGHTATTLTDGRVLVAGGFDFNGIALVPNPLSWLYNP